MQTTARIHALEGYSAIITGAGRHITYDETRTFQLSAERVGKILIGFGLQQRCKGVVRKGCAPRPGEVHDHSAAAVNRYVDITRVAVWHPCSGETYVGAE